MSDQQNSIVRKSAVDIVDGRLMPRDMEGMFRVASMLLESGLLPGGIKTAAQAMVFVNAANELKIPFTAAVTGIAIVNGRPLLHSKLPLALAIKTGEFRGMNEAWTGLNPDGSLGPASLCTVTIKRQIGEQVIEFVGRFGVADAKAAGLAGKGTHAQYPKDMIFHRAKSRALDRAFPDALCGMGTVQPEDEAEAFAPRRVENTAGANGGGVAAIIDALPADGAGHSGEDGPGPGSSATPVPPPPVALVETPKTGPKPKPRFDAEGNLITAVDQADLDAALST